MFVRKTRAGSAGPHTWAHDGDVVEVPDHVGHELVLIPDGGFSEVRDAGDVGEGDTPGVDPAMIRVAVAREVADKLPGLRAEIADELRADLVAALTPIVDRQMAAVRDELGRKLDAALKHFQTLTAGGTAASVQVSASGDPAAAVAGAAGAGSPDAPPAADVAPVADGAGRSTTGRTGNKR